MKVAILLMTYNGEKFIRAQIDSIINQTYKEWVLYINDDGSKDRTCEIVLEYVAKYPNKINLKKNETDWHGPTGNYADLFQIDSDADWFVSCGQDDVWPENRLEKLIARGAEEEKRKPGQPVLVYGKEIIVDENSNIIVKNYEFKEKLIPSKMKTQTLLMGYVLGCALIYNRALREKVEHIPKEAVWEDMYLVLVCAYFGSVVEIDDVVVYYRQHSSSVSEGRAPIVRDIIKRMRHGTKLVKRVKNYKIRTTVQMEYFYNKYKNIMTEEDKKEVETLISVINDKVWIKRMINGYRKGYYGYKGVARYTFALFMF